MAIQSPFFNKRENEPTGLRPGNTGHHPPAFASAGNTQPLVPSPPAAAPAAPVAPEGGGSKLTVGPNIKLKGVEITDCDTLVVEGLVEATMDSRVMQISQRGAFKGSAEIDIAEIHGQFDGNLTVRQKLVIYATGKVTGKIRYGKLVIEEGGQIAGEILCALAAGAAQAAPAKVALQAV